MSERKHSQDSSSSALIPKKSDETETFSRRDFLQMVRSLFLGIVASTSGVIAASRLARENELRSETLSDELNTLKEIVTRVPVFQNPLWLGLEMQIDNLHSRWLAGIRREKSFAPQATNDDYEELYRLHMDPENMAKPEGSPRIREFVADEAGIISQLNKEFIAATSRGEQYQGILLMCNPDSIRTFIESRPELTTAYQAYKETAFARLKEVALEYLASNPGITAPYTDGDASAYISSLNNFNWEGVAAGFTLSVDLRSFDLDWGLSSIGNNTFLIASLSPETTAGFSVYVDGYTNQPTFQSTFGARNAFANAEIPQVTQLWQNFHEKFGQAIEAELALAFSPTIPI